jgi:hypothetical protein
VQREENETKRADAGHRACLGDLETVGRGRHDRISAHAQGN